MHKKCCYVFALLYTVVDYLERPRTISFLKLFIVVVHAWVVKNVLKVNMPKIDGIHSAKVKMQYNSLNMVTLPEVKQREPSWSVSGCCSVHVLGGVHTTV